MKYFGWNSVGVFVFLNLWYGSVRVELVDKDDITETGFKNESLPTSTPHFKIMQQRLAILKKKYDNLNDTEKAKIQERARAFHEMMASLAPLPCVCPEVSHRPQFPLTSAGLRPPWMQQRHRQQSRPIDSYTRVIGPRSRRRRHADLRQTFSVDDPMEWWYDLDSGEENEVSKKLAEWNVGYTAHQGIEHTLDHYAFPLHLGGIDRGHIIHPELGGPGDRIFGFNPDFDHHDRHAFKWKPRGQFYPTNWVEWEKEWSAAGKSGNMPANYQFIYNPHPGLRDNIKAIAQGHVTDDISLFDYDWDPMVDGSQYLNGPFDMNDPFADLSARDENLPAGSYVLKHLSGWRDPDFPDDDENNYFNAILKNTRTGQFYRVMHADLSQLQRASPHERVGTFLGEDFPAGSVQEDWRYPHNGQYYTDATDYDLTPGGYFGHLTF